MKQRLTFLLTALLLLATNAIKAFGQDTYEKVTASPTDWSGEYLLVFENNDSTAYSWTGVDAANCYEEVSISGNNITASGFVTIVVAKMENGNDYSIQVNGGTNDGNYAYGQSGSNTIKFGTTPIANTFEFESDGIKITSNTSVMRFNNSNNNLRFRYFKSSSYTNQQPVQLYKKSEGSVHQQSVAAPTFNPAGGTYTEQQTVSISCTTDGATIHYTTNGTEPTESSDIYSNSLVINETTTVKAKAWKEGLLPSEVAEATYIIEATPLNPVLTVSTTEINDFRYIVGSGPSSSKTFTLSGSDLSTDIILTAPSNFELSFVPESGYFDNEQFSPVQGIVSEQLIYVRMKAGLEAGTYSGELTIASSGITSSISLSGFVEPQPITIAEAHALNANEYGCIEGTVIFIDGRNVYVQDETAGIVLYLNNNTVPSGLSIGDKVHAFGKRATYNGLIELSGINGGNANEFSVISSGNALPLATKTIAEINEDYANGNMLQSTRVRIQDATIGSINTGSNTLLTQNGSSINVYRIPTVEGLMEGDNVTMTGIIGCFNAPQLRVANASDILFNHRPVLTANANSISGLTYEFEQGGPSEPGHFELSGIYLVGPAMVYPSESFEVSTLSSFYPENPSIIYNPGQFYGINIYVRLKEGLEVGTYEERVYAVSQNADTIFINVSGTVTGATPQPPTPPVPAEGYYRRISDLSSLNDGSFVILAARFDENAANYYAMPNTASGKPNGVLFTSYTADGNEILPTSITDEEGSYYWVVGVAENGYTFTNAAGDMIGYGNSGTDFVTGGEKTSWTITTATAGDGAMVPAHEGFNILNATSTTRGFAMNNQFKFGAYSTSNINNESYNFYLDLFVKTEGGEPPVPPTPVVATPTFTPEAGTYFEEQSVSIACETADATIYYSSISENGPWTAYQNAITVNENMTLWAYAEKEGYDNSPVATATYTIQLGTVVIFNQDWEGDMNGWTFVTVEGSKPWTVEQHQGNHHAYANGYNGGVNEQWCISPGFNMHDYSDVALSFRNAKNYAGPDLELKYSTNYDGVDPTTATWWTFDYNMSPGSYTWVDSGEIPISITPYPAHNCYIAFKYTSTETEAAAWEVDDIMLTGVTSVPNLSATPNVLSGFTHIVDEGPSASQYFTLSGVNIGPAPGGGSTGSVIMQVTGNGFEISLDNENFSFEQYIDGINGTLPPTPVYVRLNGSEVGQYTATVEIFATSSDETTVTLSGTVNEQPVPGGDYVRIGNVSELVAGNRVILAARYNETTNAYLAAANTLTSGKLTTTEFTSTMNGNNEIIPASIMADEDSYYWTVGVTDGGYTFTNANGQVISYNSGTNFNFTGNKTEWTIENGVSAPESLVPDHLGFIITNVNNDDRSFALRVTENNSVVGAYSTSNMNHPEYNFFLDIFMQGEGGTPTVAAPTFEPTAGTYYETQDVTLNCVTDGATIYYSLESENGPWNEYEEAITVDESMTIWAYATKDDYNDSPVVSAEYVIQADLTIIFNQDWEENWNGWTEVSVMGDTTVWTIAQHNGNHYAYMNAYQQGANEDWLISPAFNLDSYSDVVLTFVTAKNYNGPDIEVYFSNDYDGEDPTTSTWQEIECALSQGSWTWTESGEINLDGFNGTNCHIAFKYTSTEEEAAGWEVDDILLVSGGGTSTDPYLVATPNTLNGLTHIVEQGPSEALTFTLTGGNFLPLPGGGYGGINLSLGDLFYNGFEMSLDGEEYTSSSLYIELDETLTLEPTTVYVRLWGDTIGSYSGSILIEEPSGVNITVSLAGEVLSANQPAISDAFMPYYIQGNNGSNNNRVPVATAVYFENLEPNTTYRYTNQFVDESDGPETAGAGNVIYANVEGFYRSTSPSLATEGGYGEFTTDENGEGYAWFINEPTANARFTPGNHVYLRIRLNDGHDGTTVAHTFTTEDYATVLNFGNEIDEYSGSAFYAKSNEAPMGFAALYTDVNHMDRPVYSTPIETTGVDYGSINQYADFYKELVAGKDGWFGGIIPNNNETGINLIWIYDMNGGSTEYEVIDGQWYPDANTVNPNVGLDEPIFIDLTYDGIDEQAESNVKIWSANHEFVIENGDNSHYTMTVYNLLGQPMMTKQINAGGSERISHNLASGLYVISLQNNKNTVSVKAIVR